MFKTLKFKNKQIPAQFWYWLLIIVTLLIGVLLSLFVAKSQDDEMRHNLIIYAKTIEQSIDWQPFSNILNTNPNQLKAADLATLGLQLNSACKANNDCHFIYLLYSDYQSKHHHVKFLLDASPQQASEISQLADVFSEATTALKKAMLLKQPLVEGPIEDRWGTWVSARIPLNVTAQSAHFVMLNVDVAVNGWNQRVLKKTIVPLLFTLLFLSVLAALIYQHKKREKLLKQMFDSTTKLTVLANNDALTGLPNRRALEYKMEQALNFASLSQEMVAVLFLDLDFFKAINDKHGHAIGDYLLKSVSKRLTQLLRTHDTVARIGGDEFIILLPSLTDEHQANATAEKIIMELSKPFNVASFDEKIGVSIGLALYPKHGDNPDELIKCADDAMYDAKRKGRNCYVLYASATSSPAS